MYEVGVVAQFEAAHHLEGNFGAATRPHGHTYRVELSVRGRRLHEDGTLCDIGRVGDALRQAVSELHYRDLSSLPAFEGRNTTAEVVSEHILKRIRPAIEQDGLDSMAVRVWESPDAYAAAEQVLTS